jgi:lipopolysaccharide export system protein LptA
MMSRSRFCPALISTVGALLLPLVTAGASLAQQSGSPFAGFSASRDQPIAFQADQVEVFDQEGRAVLTGNVRVQQGESTMATRRLVIIYEQTRRGAQPQGRPAEPVQGSQGGGRQSVREMRMEGGVIVTSKNQQATAERGVFHATRNTAVLEGRVVLTQCQNVLTGDRLLANLATNQVQVVGGATTQGRVAGVLSPSSQNRRDCTIGTDRPPTRRGT